MVLINTASISSAPTIHPSSSRLGKKERWDHFLARVGYKRGNHLVEPGIYSIGNPTPDSPVFVSANYSLSFDALRSALDKIDGYILVIDTKGINVWCAAGKGTFGTEEIIRRVMVTRLDQVVHHRKLILPQLGAPGVAAHEVKKKTGFWVEYGPVRAADLPAYLEHHQATPEMRKVQFTLRDRLVLIPVDIVNLLLPTLLAAFVFFFMGGWLSSLAVVSAVLSGIVLFPILLPWLPTHNFSTKGFFLGAMVAIPFIISAYILNPGWTWYRQAGQALVYLLAIPSVTAFLALNFTGASTFTSRTGVRREMFATIPVMAWTFGPAVLLSIGLVFIH